MIIRLIAKLIALLNSNGRASEIGAGVAYGLLLALIPGGNLLFVALALVAFLVKINLGLTLVSFGLLSVVVPVFDPLLDRVGMAILSIESLRPLYTSLAATPIVPWTQFNNTLVMGALAAGIVLFIPVTLLAAVLVRLYRKHVHARIAQSKIVAAIKATPIARKIAAALAQVRRVWPTTA